MAAIFLGSMTIQVMNQTMKTTSAMKVIEATQAKFHDN